MLPIKLHQTKLSAFLLCHMEAWSDVQEGEAGLVKDFITKIISNSLSLKFPMLSVPLLIEFTFVFNRFLNCFSCLTHKVMRGCVRKLMLRPQKNKTKHTDSGQQRHVKKIKRKYF